MIERLHEFIKNQHVSVRAFEIRIGASDGMIRRAIKNNTDIQSKWICAVADNYPQLSIEWLVTGEGEMLRPADGAPTAQQVEPTMYRDNPDKDEIIQLQRKHIRVLEEHINDLKKDLGGAFAGSDDYNPVVTSLPLTAREKT